MSTPPTIASAEATIRGIYNRLYKKGAIQPERWYYLVSIRGYLFTMDYKPVSSFDLTRMVHRLDGMGITVCIVET